VQSHIHAFTADIGGNLIATNLQVRSMHPRYITIIFRLFSKIITLIDFIAIDQIKAPLDWGQTLTNCR